MPSKHPRLNTLPADLFAGLQSFRELEARIAGFPEGSLLRGDALEVFVEAHLQNSPLLQVEEVWLVGQIPHGVRQRLGLGNNHKGIDGVFKKSDGTLVPYQVKFREGRPQVGVGDTSSFFMLTEGLAQRTLISNSDRYSNDVRDRQNLQIISGLHFDDLTAEDFARIDNWLKNRPTIPRRELPMRRHQERAVAAIVNELRSEARATAVMPCGSGKTLVGLRVVEELKPRNVVVFVPSLALLAQLLEDWAKDRTWGKRFRYLCVCSEPAISAEVDRWETDPKDVPFEVKTDPSVVRSFLEHGSDEDIIRVVFSTYHSADKVAKGLPAGFRFDVGVFDEAHKTTEGRFGLALKDESLPIDRRLFLTATPRHIDARRRNKEGDFNVVSMDNAAVYGRQTFRQSFGEAVVDEIICDYRVVVSVVDRSEISEHAERYGITLVQNDPKQFKWVAAQIAVTKAIAETGATKVITFHTDRKQAKHFASSTSHGIKQFLPDFELGYVDGKQPVADRKDNLRCLYGRGKGLVSNAKCLTEGVDLPALDAVVFNNPRRSKVDIVQAVGRAMRKPPNSDKQFGYVVIPVFLEQRETEDLEAACCGTEWEDLVAVIAALRDHDPRLEEIICEAQEAVGRGKVFDPRPFGEKITILGGPEVSLDTIQQHVSAVILERLGETWDLRYGQLQTYKEEHGDCHVPINYRDNPELAKWLSRQRQAKRKGILSVDRESKLTALGVEFDPLEAHWRAMFGELKLFKTHTNHCNVPQRYKENPLLGAWVSIQRALVKRPDYSAERKRLLDELGFDWDPLESAWFKFFQALTLFKEKHGHLDVPRDYPACPKLNVWCSQQRTRYRRGELEAPRVSLLEGLGFPWMKKPAKSLSMLDEMRLFKQTKGHCNVPRLYSENPRLGTWVTVRRKMWRNGTIDAQEFTVLNSLGFVWDPTEEAWSRNIEALKNFKELTGHCNVPRWYSENQPLATWLQAQRKAKRAGRLLASREAQLKNLGVELPPESNKAVKHESRRHAQNKRSGSASKGSHGQTGDATAVAQYDSDGRQLVLHSSISSAASHAKCSMENLRQVLIGRRATAGGYRWHYHSEAKPAPNAIEPLKKHRRREKLDRKTTRKIASPSP